LGPDERRFADGEVRATLNGLFQVFDWFWVNHPDRSRIAGSKVLQLKTAREIGFRIPKTLVTNDPERVRAFFHACAGNIIYKPFYSGFFAGTENACFTSPVSLEKLSQIDLIANTPGIFQETIPKRIELRITVIGRKVSATEIHSQTSAESLSDWRRADIETLPHDVHALPHDIEERCLKLLDRFDVAYGQSAANRSPRKNAYCRPFDLALDRSSAPSLRAEDRRIGLEHAQDDVADVDVLARIAAAAAGVVAGEAVGAGALHEGLQRRIGEVDRADRLLHVAVARFERVGQHPDVPLSA
jgi:hypothetical protein